MRSFFLFILFFTSVAPVSAQDKNPYEIYFDLDYESMRELPRNERGQYLLFGRSYGYYSKNEYIKAYHYLNYFLDTPINSTNVQLPQSVIDYQKEVKDLADIQASMHKEKLVEKDFWGEWLLVSSGSNWGFNTSLSFKEKLKLSPLEAEFAGERSFTSNVQLTKENYHLSDNSFELIGSGGESYSIKLLHYEDKVATSKWLPDKPRIYYILTGTFLRVYETGSVRPNRTTQVCGNWERIYAQNIDSQVLELSKKEYEKWREKRIETVHLR